jgi:hypothetical protein
VIFHLVIAKRSITLHLNESGFRHDGDALHRQACIGILEDQRAHLGNREWIFSRGAYGAYSFVRWAVWRDNKQVSGWEIRGPLVQFKGKQA